jgi:hypothetical protein
MNMREFRAAGLIGLLAAMLTAPSPPSWADETKNEHTVGIRYPFGVWKKVKVSDLLTEMDLYVSNVGIVNQQVQGVKFDPNAPKDEIEKRFEGAISLDRHRADLNALREQISLCMASMESKAAARREDGELGAEEEKTLAECRRHCQNVLDETNKLYHNSSIMVTANRKTYFLKAWEEHKRMMTQLEKLAADCPMMMAKSLKITGDPAPEPVAKPAAEHQH